jgi:tetratricopeptide (TPR) repeat protein
MARTMLISMKMLEAGRNPPFVMEAISMLESGEFAGARSKLEEGMKGGERPVEGLLALASAYWDDPDQRSRDPKKSIEYLKEAIDLAPKDARPYALLGRYLLSKGLRDQALNFLDRAIQLDPENADARKLRDRASLQKKKQYTVVVQAKDFNKEQTPKRKGGGVGQAEGFKKQATRLLKLEDIGGAAAELEKAQHGVGAQVDNALSALLSADLLQADRALLEGAGARGRGVAIVRTLIAFTLIAAVGLVVGAAVSRLMPEPKGTPEEQLLARLASDRASTLQDVLNRGLEVEGPQVQGALALANILLLLEHGGDEGHLQNAEDSLSQADSAGRNTPAALLARALLADIPLANPDPELKSALERAAADEKTRDDPWVLMAVAARAKPSARLALLTRAAFVDDAPVRALHQLARTHAARGERQLALDLLERIWDREPQHGASLATAIAVASMTPKGREEATTMEKKALEVLGTEIDPADAAPPALMISAVATARGDDGIAGQMRERAEEKDVLLNYPGLLSVWARLGMLEVGDFPDIRSRLEKGIERWPSEIPLRVDLTRAKVLSSLPDDRVRRLRTNSDNKIEDGRLILPLGALSLDFEQGFLPLRPTFDTRFFPEEAINDALAIKGLTPAAAERRLGVVANLKLAEVALAGGDIDTASKFVAVALDEAPSDPEVHLTQALIHARQGKGSKARDAIDEAQRIAPDDPRILLAAARMQLAAGDARAARKALNRLDDEGFRSPTAFVVASELALRKGDFDDAEKALDEARKFGPEDVQVLAMSVRFAAAKGDIDSGIASARRLKKATPDLGRIIELMPEIEVFLVRLGAQDDPEKTMEKLTDLARAKPTAAVANLVIGDMEASRDNADAAREALEAAKEAAKKGPLFDAAEARLSTLSGDETVEEPKQPKRRKRRRGKRRRR